MPVWMLLSFQESMSPEMESITFFHDFSMIVVVFICVLSAYFIFACLLVGSFDSYIMESHDLELIWTLLPAVFLFTLAVPSMKVLYFTEESYSPLLSFKVVGHQWYWSYEVVSSPVDDIESFMESSTLSRLLKTSSLLSFPVLSSLRGLVTSLDVIHSWSVPSLGVKADAVPGRLNQVFIYSKFNSLVTGQCSEICGANHSFMPIVLVFT